MCSSCSQCFLCGCEGVKCVVLCLYRAGVGGDIPAGRGERCVLRAVSVFSVAVRGLSVLCCVYIEQVWVEETFLQVVVRDVFFVQSVFSLWL